MKTLRHFTGILDYQTFVVSVLAVVATWLCRRYNLVANLPSGLIGVAIVFPIVFSINAAYKRREEALKHFASLRAHVAALHFVHRDWPPAEAKAGQAERALAWAEDLFAALCTFFKAKEADRPTAYNRVYGVFSDISRSHELLRQAGVPANEVSRANQYLKAIMVDFERMRNIARYRTPLSLRAYSRVFLNAFPVLFGPFFAYLAVKSIPAVGYLVALLYSVVLVSLDNIQEDLEDPFDGIGVDDVKLDVTDEYRAAVGTES